MLPGKHPRNVPRNVPISGPTCHIRQYLVFGTVSRMTPFQRQTTSQDDSKQCEYLLSQEICAS
eukprot:4212438-Prymnesium_polylepis.1